MTTYLLTRAAQSLLAMGCVLALVFFMVRLTGDPTVVMLPQDASKEDVAQFRKAMGFDRPLAVQFGDFVRRAVVGDFGKSLQYRTSAWSLIMERLPATLELAVVAMLFAILVAVPLGILAATRPGSRVGRAAPRAWRCSARRCPRTGSGSS